MVASDLIGLLIVLTGLTLSIRKDAIGLGIGLTTVFCVPGLALFLLITTGVITFTPELLPFAKSTFTLLCLCILVGCLFSFLVCFLFFCKQGPEN